MFICFLLHVNCFENVDNRNLLILLQILDFYNIIII